MTKAVADVIEYLDAHKEEVLSHVKDKYSCTYNKLTETIVKEFRQHDMEVSKKTAIRFVDTTAVFLISLTKYPHWYIAHSVSYYVLYDPAEEAASKEVDLTDKLELAMDNVSPYTFMNNFIQIIKEDGSVGWLQLAKTRDSMFDFLTVMHQFLCVSMTEETRKMLMDWVLEVRTNDMTKPGRLKRVTQKHLITHMAKSPERFVSNPALKDIAKILLTDPDCVPKYLERVEKAYQKLLKSK